MCKTERVSSPAAARPSAAFRFDDDGDFERALASLSAAPSFAQFDLADLVEDEGGEIVFYNDSDAPGLTVRTDVPVSIRGEVEDHVTAAGVDVGGYAYLTFANGLTLYVPADVEVEVESTEER